MIAAAQREATTKIGSARTVLLKPHVRTGYNDSIKRNISAVQLIGEHQPVWRKGGTNREGFPTRYCVCRRAGSCRIDNPVGRQTDHPNIRANGKSTRSAWRLDCG